MSRCLNTLHVGRNIRSGEEVLIPPMEFSFNVSRSFVPCPNPPHCLVLPAVGKVVGAHPGQLHFLFPVPLIAPV